MNATTRRLVHLCAAQVARQEQEAALRELVARLRQDDSTTRSAA